MEIERICQICGTKFTCDKKSSKQCCSKQCSSTMRKKTNIEKYGCTNVASLPINKKCICVNCGKEFIGHNNNSKYCEDCTKLFNTNITKICANCGKEFLDRSKLHNRILCRKCKCEETNLQRYGVSNPFQSQIIKAKIRSTNIQKYGVENPNQSEIIKQKINITNQERYGAKWTFQSEEIKNRIKETNLKRYGVENPNQSTIIKNKKQIKSLLKYNTTCVLQSDEVKQKIAETNLVKYGKPFASQSQTIKDKVKTTNLQNLGVEYTFQSPNVRQKITETNIKRYGTSCALLNPNIKLKSIKSSISRYGVPYNCMRKECRYKAKVISKTNLRFQNKLNELGINTSLEYNLENKSFNLMILDNLLVEIDPTWTHNCYCNYIGKVYDKVDRNAQLSKTLLADKYNFKCIHIFDWDNQDKIIQILGPKINIYARKTILKEVSKLDTDNFLNNYHLQDSCRGQTIKLGLYYNNELVQVMTFGKPRYNKHYNWELLRLCTHPKYRVIGGASKLFNYFLSEYKADSIISYCDRAKFNGDVYYRLGFKLDNYTKPNKHWSKGTKHITDNLLRQKGFDKLFGTDYGKGTSNEQLMIQNKWLPVYDCGQLVFIYNKESI